MKNLFLLLLLLFIWQSTFCQTTDSLNQDASPKGGVHQLAIHYYGIDFTKEQRENLANTEIELIFLIDTLGRPTLSEINGVTDRDIIDSLKARTLEIEPYGQKIFNPRIRNGVPEPAIYFIKLVFPTYKMTQGRYRMLQGMAYNEADLMDFEYIRKSGRNLDMLLGGVINQFIGNPSKYLSTGGGMKVDMSYTAKNQYLYGLNMSIYGNKLKRDYPLHTNRDQLPGPPTILIGAIFGKWFGNYNIQGEIHMATQNLTEKVGENDPDWIQLNGWSPGVVINYSLGLGKEKPMYYYGSPKLLGNNLNVHIGFRYMSYSLQEASGFMTELGIGYRMTVQGVKEYKLKDEFFSK